jgi:hypothetical protein
MRKITALALALSAVFGSPAFGQSLVGEWVATAHIEGADVAETLVVAKAGESYTVTAALIGVPPGTPNAGPGTDIVLDGDKFSFRRKIAPDSPVEIEYKGVVAGDTFTGTAEIAGAGPGMKVSYTGVRKAADR